MVFSFHIRMIVYQHLPCRDISKSCSPGPIVQVSNRFKWYNRWTWLTKGCVFSQDKCDILCMKNQQYLQVWRTVWRKSTRCKSNEQTQHKQKTFASPANARHKSPRDLRARCQVQTLHPKSPRWRGGFCLRVPWDGGSKIVLPSSSKVN